MSIVVNKADFRVIYNANTPDFLDGNWLINPVIPNCASKYWKLVGETLEEMTQAEKDEVDYSTASTIYLIAEKQLLSGKNGHDYEGNPNALINPTMPNCDIRYTKVVAGAVVEMTDIEKNIVDHPQQPIEPIRRDLNNISNIHKLRLDSISIINQINTNAFSSEDIIPAIKKIVVTHKAILDMILNL